MLLSEVKNQTFRPTADKEYQVLFERTDYLGLIVGTRPESTFAHPHICAVWDDVYNLKHDTRNRGKFWTQRAGRSFLFVIPGDRIELLDECGYSYVPCCVDGKEFSLNVSGGTHNGWTDIVPAVVNTHIDAKTGFLQALADNAVSVQEAQRAGFRFALKPNHLERIREDYRRIMAKRILSNQWREGMVVHLRQGATVGGKSTVRFYLRRRRKKSLICKDHYGSQVNVAPQYIDWLKSAEANEVKVPEPRLGYYISPEKTEDAS